MTPSNESIQSVLTALLDTGKPFSPKHLHRFSDLIPEDVALLEKSWNEITLQRKLALFFDLQEILGADTLVNFDELAVIGFKDSDPQVRMASIQLLDYCEDTRIVPKFLSMLQSDPDEKVRSEAASALGYFVDRGELEAIPARIYNQIMDELFKVINGKDASLVRRRALESVSYSCRDTIPGLIEQAFQSKEKPWRLSALLSMGRSADERWEKQVVEMIASPDLELKAEAIQAAGELELKSTRATLLGILKDQHSEPEIQTAVVWALSKIGGESVRSTLEKLLAETDDDDEMEFIEETLDNLTFSKGDSMNEMLDIGIHDEDELDEDES